MSDRASASAVDQEEKRLLAMAADAKVGFGASNPRLFVRSLLSALPHLSHLSQQSHSLSHNLSDSDLSLDDSYGNDAEQVDNDISGSNTQDSATPSLSLPESFDRPYEYSPVLRKPQAFAAVTAQVR